MSIIALRDAKAGLSELVDQAVKGEFVTITRDGKPVAAVVSLEAAEATRTVMQPVRKNFRAHLLDFPGCLELERDTSAVRDVDL